MVDPSSLPPREPRPVRGGADDGLDVLLRGAFQAAAPSHETAEAELAEGTLLSGRYEVRGFFARGGVGAVHRGFDREVGREVALKVLRRRHVARPDLARRLTIEGRLLGRLEHPAIVPLHDLGVCPDGRPFLVLKLVQGETLAGRLARLERDEHARGALLGVLLQTAQAIGYAHARGVVHRDLKPANVMVGDHGEVQVMDFGLAKVLDPDASGTGEPSDVERDAPATGAASVAGSVMGTYAYMPPEQARGEVARIDARSDVFSLGALLCEVLTGAPPYTGDAETLRSKARSADLGDARARLEALDSERGLLDLCRACLAEERDLRPKDGAQVARMLAAHLADAADRARRAELAQVRAEERLLGQGRRRRLQTLLVASLALVLLVIGGATWAVERASARRAAGVARAVDDAIASAGALVPRLDADPSQAQELWRAATEGARQVEALAAAPEADEATRARAASFAAQVRADEAATRAAREASRVDHALRARLVSSQLERERSLDWDSAAREYAAAFTVAGLDPLKDPEAVLAAIARSAVPSEVIDGLDAWRRALANLGRKDEPSYGALVALVTRAEDDPLRRRAREASDRKDAALARELAASCDPTRDSAVAVTLIASALAATGARDEAKRLLDEALVVHPADFWMHVNRGFLGLEDGPDGALDAAMHWAATFALAPDNWSLARNLVAALDAGGRRDEAIAMAEALAKRWPDQEDLASNHAVLLEHAGRIEEAYAAYERAHVLEPQWPGSRMAMAQMLRRMGRHEEARAVLEAAIAADVVDANLYLSYGALLCDYAREYDAAEAAFRRVNELAPGEPKGWRNLVVALRAQGDAEGALAVIPRWIALQPDAAEPRSTAGEVLAQLGRLSDARDRFVEAIERSPRDARLRFNLSILQSDLGDDAAAVEALRAAVALDPGYRDGWHMLAYHLATLQELDAARAANDEALRIDPNYAEAWYQRGRILWHAGEREASLAAFQRVLELAPSHAAAKEFLDRQRE